MYGHICIGEECISCGACIPECPEDAIWSEGDTVCVDPEACMGNNGNCGIPCWEVCPVDAITGVGYINGWPSQELINEAVSEYGCSLCGSGLPPIT